MYGTRGEKVFSLYTKLELLVLVFIFVFLFFHYVRSFKNEPTLRKIGIRKENPDDIGRNLYLNISGFLVACITILALSSLNWFCHFKKKP